MDICQARPEATVQLSQAMNGAASATAESQQQKQGWGFTILLAPVGAIATFGMQAWRAVMGQPANSKAESANTSYVMPEHKTGLVSQQGSPTSDDQRSYLKEQAPGGDVGEHPEFLGTVLRSSPDGSLISSAHGSLHQTPQKDLRDSADEQVHPQHITPAKGTTLHHGFVICQVLFKQQDSLCSDTFRSTMLCKIMYLPPAALFPLQPPSVQPPSLQPFFPSPAFPLPLHLTPFTQSI